MQAHEILAVPAPVEHMEVEAVCFDKRFEWLSHYSFFVTLTVSDENIIARRPLRIARFAFTETLPVSVIPKERFCD
jgi:hypothetical protein